MNVFIGLRTQWRIGFGGATGLDYSAIEPVMRLQGVPRKQWRDVFECVAVMEGEALKVMEEQRKALAGNQ